MQQLKFAVKENIRFLLHDNIIKKPLPCGGSGFNYGWRLCDLGNQRRRTLLPGLKKNPPVAIFGNIERAKPVGVGAVETVSRAVVMPSGLCSVARRSQVLYPVRHKVSQLKHTRFLLSDIYLKFSTLLTGKCRTVEQHPLAAFQRLKHKELVFPTNQALRQCSDLKN